MHAAFWGLHRTLATLALLLGSGIARQVQAKGKDLAPNVDLAINKTEAAHLFSVVKTRWKASFRPSELRSQLEGLASGNLKMSAELKQLLYSARKSTAIVRSGFQVLDQHHYKPKALDAYVRAAGKLNDAINSERYVAVPALAGSVLKVLRIKKIQAEVETFVPSRKGSFQGYLQASMKFVRATKGSKKLPAPVYHQLRKELANLLVAFDPKSKLSPEARKLYNRLHKIRLEMGDVHDVLVAKKLRGGAYDSVSIGLSKSTKRDLRNVLRSLRVRQPANENKHYKRWKSNIKAGRGAKRAAPSRVRAR